MSMTNAFRRLCLGYALVAAGLAAAVLIYYPVPFSRDWGIAFATLLGLAILSSYLALVVTPGGVSSTVDFLAHLAAIVLLGPAGTVLLAITQLVIVEFGFLRKPAARAAFNVAQVTIASAVGAVLYDVFGGAPNLTDIVFRQSFAPFMVAVLAYWATNGVAFSWAINALEGRPRFEVWKELMGVIIVFDIAMSTVSFLIAFMYVRYGPVSLLAAIVPMIGLRYSYGVNIQLQQLNQDLLRVLIKTLEARDRYTSGHSERVARRSKRIAQQLGLRGKTLHLIETGALLHDIGKIDLAYGEILRQTGPLTPEQRELIRAHPDKGVEIVSSVRSLDPRVLECIRFHHEWFDGSGYPTGLAGDDIPIGARVIMISDSVDAMMTDRPYRKALSPEEVRKELLRNSGSQFDPVVVEAALDARILDADVLAAE